MFQQSSIITCSRDQNLFFVVVKNTPFEYLFNIGE